MQEKIPTEESTKEKEVIKPPETETAIPETPAQPKTSAPVPDATDSLSKLANNTDETKATPDKTPKSVLSLVHDQKRPKAAPRPPNVNSRISTGSRNSGANEGKKNYTVFLLLVLNVKSIYEPFSHDLYLQFLTDKLIILV